MENDFELSINIINSVQWNNVLLYLDLLLFSVKYSNLEFYTVPVIP
jgi:hypothetical protein